MHAKYIATDPTLAKLFSRTFKHPYLGAMLQWVPMYWLHELANPLADDRADLGTWPADAPLVGRAELYANLLATGMRDPFIVGVGRVTRKVRLEAGNHRVKVLLSNGVFYAPAVAYVGDSAITHPGNGAHEGLAIELRLPLVPAQADIMGPYPVKEYVKLSNVLSRMPTLA